jgi:hypothetical protein
MLINEETTTKWPIHNPQNTPEGNIITPFTLSLRVMLIKHLREVTVLSHRAVSYSSAVQYRIQCKVAFSAV